MSKILKNRKIENFLVVYPPGWGGVNVAMKGLAEGLMLNGHKVIEIEGWKSIAKLSFWRLARREDTVVISCLLFGIVNFVFRNSIYMLHAFPRWDYGRMRTILVWMGTVVFSRLSDECFAVSGFAAFINKNIVGAKVDGVIPNSHVSKIGEMSMSYENSTKKNVIFYAGKLLDAKGVRKILSGFEIYKQRGGSMSLSMAGGGELEQFVKSELDRLNENWLGLLDGAEVERMCQESKVFVSLCEGEAFGLSLLEAMSANCIVIAPSIGGHLDFMINDSGVIFLNNPITDLDVANAFFQAEISEVSFQRNFDNFMPKNIFKAF